MDSPTDIIAPFVMKTYQMVNDPVTDNLIRWGRANNSFIVVEPLDFSHRLLPVYFKHNNFSSFVRQLNTYGFRKVDPDRWEFANECFLRGQIILLSQITRKKHSPRSNYPVNLKFEDDEEDEMMIEIARLKDEQKSLDKELQGMNKRLEATERRPGQMMAFLYKVAEDPEIVPRMMLEKDERSKKFKEKKRRLLISPPSSSSPCSSGVGVSNSVKSEEEGESGGTVGGISSPEANFSADTFCQSSPSPEMQSMAWMSRRPVDVNYGGFASESPGMGVIGGGGGGGGGGDWSFFGGVSSVAGEVRPTPYPFSLLEGGF